MTISIPEWVQDAVFYQIFPDRFAFSQRFEQDGYPAKPNHLQEWGAPPTTYGFQGGDLLGAAEKLDYLADLGINAIYLNPIFQSASNHRYHTHDYFTVDPILGGNRAFEVFLQAAHERGIRVILDGVFNHASRGFFQFNHLLECGEESPYRDWFHVHAWPLNAYDTQHPPNFDAWWGIHSLPKFNTDNTAVREFLWSVGTYWLEKGIDGWRLDVPNEIDDDEFWREFRRRCRAINPEAYIVGELWGDAQRWLQGDQFDAQMNYMFSRAALGFFGGQSVDQSDSTHTGLGYIQPLNGRQFADELNRIFNQTYAPEIVLAQMNMLGSHDTPRILTVVNEDATAVSLMFFCQMTVPGAPNIYYGDEIGLPGRRDPDCRRAFPWQDEASWNHSLLAQVQSLIRLRREIPALRRGDFTVLYANEVMVVYQRQYEGQTAVIALNTAPDNQSFSSPPDFPGQLPERVTETGQIFQKNETYTLYGRSGRIWAD